MQPSSLPLLLLCSRRGPSSPPELHRQRRRHRDGHQQQRRCSASDRFCFLGEEKGTNLACFRALEQQIQDGRGIGGINRIKSNQRSGGCRSGEASRVREGARCSGVEADAAVVPALHAATEAAEGGLLRLRLRGGGRRAGSHHSRGARRLHRCARRGRGGGFAGRSLLTSGGGGGDEFDLVVVGLMSEE